MYDQSITYSLVAGPNDDSSIYYLQCVNTEGKNYDPNSGIYTRTQTADIAIDVFPTKPTTQVVIMIMPKGHYINLGNNYALKLAAVDIFCSFALVAPMIIRTYIPYFLKEFGLT